MARKKNRETTMPRNQMSLEGPPDISPPLPDVLNKLTEIIQVKVNTDERIQNLEQTVQEVHNRRESDLSLIQIKEVKENLKRELIDEVKEDVKRELIYEVKEDIKRELIVELNKMCTEYMENHSRNQSIQMQKARFRLQINSEVISPAYKGRPIQTRESDGCIVVELYEGDSLIRPDHPLASVTVQLVVIHDKDFDGIEGYWSEDYFTKRMAKNVKYGKFALHNGSCRHEGAVITETSNRMEVKLGVMIVDLEENIKGRVLEGVSKPFKVQETKTEPINNRGKRKLAADDVSPTMMHNPAKKINARVAGQHNSYPPTQQMVSNVPSLWNLQQREHMSTQEAGTNLGGQPQAYYYQKQHTAQQETPEQKIQGQHNSYPPTQQMVSNVPSLWNLQQREHMSTQEAGTNLGGQPQAYYYQKQHTAQQETPEQKIQESTVDLLSNLQDQQNSLPPTPQMVNNAPSWKENQGGNMLFGLGLTPAPFCSPQNGTGEQLPANQSQQQHTTQQGTPHLQNSVQGQQNSLPPTKNMPIGHTREPGNNLDGQPTVDQLQPRSSTQQGAPEVKNTGVPTPGFNGCNPSGPTAPLNPQQRSEDANGWISDFNFDEAGCSATQLNPSYH